MNWPAHGRVASDTGAMYRERGIVALGQVLGDDELVAVRAAIEGMAREHGVTGSYACIVHDAWRRSSVLADLVPGLGARACAAVGVDELVLFHDHVLIKPPGGDDMAWHQDFSYLPIDRPGGLTLWIALDDISEDNGCLYYAPGSHRQGERRAAWGMREEGDPRARLPAIELTDDEAGVPMATPAGHGVAHHELVLHRSPKNASQRPRRSWALSLVSPEARWAPDHSPHPRSAVSPRHAGQALEPELVRVRAAGAERGAR